MRTTVDLPPGIHRRAGELARRRGESLSATLADLTARGLSRLDEPIDIRIDERTGFPVMSLGLGRVVTGEEVADLLDDERPASFATLDEGLAAELPTSTFLIPR